MDISSAGLGGAINSGFEAISRQTADIQARMSEIANMNSEDQNVAMLEMQFTIGQYNAMIEATSNMVKTLSDALKSVAQKM